MQIPKIHIKQCYQAEKNTHKHPVPIILSLWRSIRKYGNVK